MCILIPSDAGWYAARATFNALIDQRPRAIAVPTDAREVAAVVSYARKQGLRVAPQATGHNAGPLGSLEDVHRTLDALIERELVERLPRRPGQKEERYAHLLGGDAPPAAEAFESTQAPPAPPVPSDLEERVRVLEEQVAALQRVLDER